MQLSKKKEAKRKTYKNEHKKTTTLIIFLFCCRLSMQNPQRAISALSLLITCMYTGREPSHFCTGKATSWRLDNILCFTGKIGDRPSGIYPQPDTVEFPTEDIHLIAMERVTVLFDRLVWNLLSRFQPLFMYWCLGQALRCVIIKKYIYLNWPLL